MSNKPTYDRWGNLKKPEPPPQTVAPPNSGWLGQGNTGLPPVRPQPPYGPSRSDYPPPPSFHMELPPPSPPSMPTTGGFGFSTSIRFGPPASGSQSLPPGHSTRPSSGGPPPFRHAPTPTSSRAPPPPIHPIPQSEAEKRYASPAFSRPVCNTCRGNSVTVREGTTNFCETDFQDALRRRGKAESSKASRPTCRICDGNCISVKEGDNIYCEDCWQEALRKRGVRDEERH